MAALSFLVALSCSYLRAFSSFSPYPLCLCSIPPFLRTTSPMVESCSRLSSPRATWGKGMVTNDRIILDEVLNQGLDGVDPGTTASTFFEFFTAEQILKDFDLSVDEIESGLVGDGGDGGIDAIYVLVNGELVQEDPAYDSLRGDITIDLIVVQSKTHAGFQETPIERFITVSNDLFDLSQDLAQLASIYNERLLEVIRHFRDVWRQLANQLPTLNLSFFYACKGTGPNDNISS